MEQARFRALGGGRLRDEFGWEIEVQFVGSHDGF
jgi:hypothetical protein